MRTALALSLLALLGTPLLAPPALADGQRVRLDARLGHPALAQGQKHTTWLKVGLTGFAMEAKGERTPINVALVLDKSGSMSGEKIMRAKEAARRAVDQLAADDIVSIIAYDSTVRVLVPATKASDKEAIRDGIDRITPGGNTALFAGVSKGADELRKFLDKERVNRVVLLSDGLANVGPQSPGELERLGSRLAREGMSVTTLGLGLDYNEDLMVRLARASDGNHVFVERADDLARFFALEFGDVTSVVAQDVVVTIECAEGIRPVRVLGRDADIVGQRVTARIRQIVSEREKFVLLEVEVPPGEVGAKLDVARVQVSYGNLATRTTDTLDARVGAEYVADKAEMERQADKKVMVDAVQLIATEKNRVALTLRDEGRQQEAQQVLQDNALFLQKNYRRWGTSSLKDLSKSNEDDAKNLDGENWNRQRKKMRRVQYKFDSQQSY
ncbi:MAG: VWA domain-containing protein [Myxococcales bacterium]|nr:VWA domain-containing protein [Myxococcales bacterium]